MQTHAIESLGDERARKSEHWFSTVALSLLPTKKKEVVMKLRHACMGVAALSAALGSTSAKAQSRETVSTTGPNRSLLHSGIFVLGVPYVTSVIVATGSSHSGDDNLYIPVAGPWMDLANRGHCGGFGEATCDNETTNKVLLVVDGIFQGIGALDIVGAFVFPETRTVSVSSLPPRVVVAPAYWGKSGYGVSALATF
jgi:hypothetical protein